MLLSSELSAVAFLDETPTNSAGESLEDCSEAGPADRCVCAVPATDDCTSEVVVAQSSVPPQGPLLYKAPETGADTIPPAGDPSNRRSIPRATTLPDVIISF